MTSTFTPERLRTLLATQAECERRDRTIPDGTGNHVCNALRDVAVELARELLAMKELSGWQPIDTAPKDGTYVIVRQAGVLEPSMTICSFDKEWGEHGWWMCCDGKNPELPLRGPCPSEWMPLPNPPRSDEPVTIDAFSGQLRPYHRDAVQSALDGEPTSEGA